MFKTLEDAIALAEYAHRHQVDKAGFAYVEHPKRVLAAVQAQGVPPYVQIAAVLHDVIEDTPFTGQILISLGFSEAAVSLIWTLSRGRYSSEHCKDPDDYYRAIAESPMARIIKLADIADNLQPWRISYLDPTTQARLREKYRKALEVIG